MLPAHQSPARNMNSCNLTESSIGTSSHPYKLASTACGASDMPRVDLNMYYNIKSDKNLRKYECFNTASPSWTPY